jgi:hypothetical protein
LYSTADPDSAYSLFLETFKDIYNKTVPIVHSRIKINSKNHKPWISSGILKSQPPPLLQPLVEPVPSLEKWGGFCARKGILLVKILPHKTMFPLN